MATHRIVHGVDLRETEPNGYDFVVGQYDFHLRLEKIGEEFRWALDQFLLDVKDADKANVNSTEVESLSDGVLYAIAEGE